MEVARCNRCNSYNMAKGTSDKNAFTTIFEGELNLDGTVKKAQ